MINISLLIQYKMELITIMRLIINSRADLNQGRLINLSLNRHKHFHHNLCADFHSELKLLITENINGFIVCGAVTLKKLFCFGKCFEQVFLNFQNLLCLFIVFFGSMLYLPKRKNISEIHIFNDVVHKSTSLILDRKMSVWI